MINLELFCITKALSCIITHGRKHMKELKKWQLTTCIIVVVKKSMSLSPHFLTTCIVEILLHDHVIVPTSSQSRIENMQAVVGAVSKSVEQLPLKHRTPSSSPYQAAYFSHPLTFTLYFFLMQTSKLSIH